MKNIWTLIVAGIRSAWFCIRWLPWREAVKLPVLIAPNVRIRQMWRGGLVMGNPSFNRIHIGFHCGDATDEYGSHTIISVEKGARIVAVDDVHVGRGAIIHVGKNSTLTLGRNFAISGTTTIICNKEITFGDDVQFSWNTLVMDCDAHRIYDNEGKQMNAPAPIRLGNKIWVGAGVSLMKRTEIPDNCIVAGGSMVNRRFEESGCILAGSPARVVRKFDHWDV